MLGSIPKAVLADMLEAMPNRQLLCYRNLQDSVRACSMSAAMPRQPARKGSQAIQKLAGFEVQVSWDAFIGFPVEAANAFGLNVVPGPGGTPQEIVLNAGFLAPPPLVGNPEQQIAKIQSLGSALATVRPIIRLTFSKERAHELRAALEQILAIADAGSARG